MLDIFLIVVYFNFFKPVTHGAQSSNTDIQRLFIQCGRHSLPIISQIAKFMGPTWGPPGSCWPQMAHVDPMNLAIRDDMIKTLATANDRALHISIEWLCEGSASLFVCFINGVLSMFNFLQNLTWLMYLWEKFNQNKTANRVDEKRYLLRSYSLNSVE